MNGWACTAEEGDQGNYRLAIALLLAGALHAAVMLSVELPPREHADDLAVLEFTLTAAPAQPDADAAGGSYIPASPPVPAGTVAVRSETSAAPGEGVDAGLSAVVAAQSEVVAAQSEVVAAQSAPAPRLGPESAAGSAGDFAAAPRTPVLDSPQPFERPAGLRGLPYPELAKAIASFEARGTAQQAGAEQARTGRLSSNSTKTVAEAAYLDMWRQKVERIGRANYPAGGVSGELLLLAVIRYDGTLEEVRILESSGRPVVDETALRIVRLAAPYAHFPTELRKSYDRLEIVRSWRFARTGAL